MKHIVDKVSRVIGVRELVRNTKAVSKETRKGVSFLVMRNTEPLFRIEPVDQKQGKKYTKDDLFALQFHGGDKDLSKRVDEILYNT